MCNLEFILKINDYISAIVWGPIMITLILGLGIYLTLKTHFFQFTHFFDMLKSTIFSLTKPRKTKNNGISPFQAVSTALAGTLGTGNIVGVATAISAGGPGAVFWMWVSATLGMIIKYSEVLLSVKFRVLKDNKPYGGPMYVMERGLHSKFLAKSFCIFCVLASFGIGSTVQSNSAAMALNSGLSIPLPVSGFLFFILSLLVIAGGVKRIGATAEKVVPAMAAIYTILALFIIINNREYISFAFKEIFCDAFNFSASSSGVLGYMVSRAIRFGVSRGIFSNEAGLGSAPIAHAAADVESAPKQGFWGMFEVFFDTIVMCTVTALVLLTSNVVGTDFDGSEMTIAAFSTTVGNLAGSVIAISMTFFAFASIIGWAYYGEQSVSYLFKGKGVFLYRIIYSFSAGLGCILSLSAVWRISDTLNGLMAIPNLISIFLLIPVILDETCKYKKLNKKNK